MRFGPARAGGRDDKPGAIDASSGGTIHAGASDRPRWACPLSGRRVTPEGDLSQKGVRHG
jgi:hypothetical protein